MALEVHPELHPGRSFAGFLFDMDGTILSSIASAERIWAVWARAHGLDVESFLPTIHGVQSVETIRRLGLPGVDPVQEAARITEAEIADAEGVQPIPGADDFLAALPPARWGIVTSAPRALAQARLRAAGLPLPGVMITAEDAPRSKPEPDGYRLAAERLGAQAADCLVFEDAPAGIAAGEAAGAALVVITALHRHPLATPHPAVTDFRGLQGVAHPEGRLSLTLRADLG